MRYLIAVLCALGVLVTQALYGGALRPVFALPGLFLAGVAGALGMVSLLWRNEARPSGWCVGWVLAFAGWLVWREVHSPDPWLAAGYLRLTLGCLVLYLVFACVVTHPFPRLVFLGVLFGGAVVQAGAAVCQFLWPDTGPLIPWMSEQLRLWYASKWNWRGHGTYLNGNHLVWFLNAAGLTALSFFCWGRWGARGRVVFLGVALVSFAGVVVTLSRGGMVGLIAGLVVFLVLSVLGVGIGLPDRRIGALVMVVIAILLAGSAAFLIFSGSLLVQYRVSEITNDAYREAIFGAVWRQAQVDPVQGTGAGTFLYFGRMFRDHAAESDDIYAHNDWMQVLADFGFPAVVLLLGVVGTHAGFGFRKLLRVFQKRMNARGRRQSHVAALLIATLACLGAFSVHSLFDFNMQIPANALLAAALLGMVANPGVTSAGQNSRAADVLHRGTCVLSGLVGFTLIVLVSRAAAPESFWLRAENAELTGRPGDALLLAEADRLGTPHPQTERVLGRLYLSGALSAASVAARRHWADRAAEIFEDRQKICPLDGDNLLLLAEARSIQGQPKTLEDAAVAAILRDPHSGRAYELYAKALEDQGRLPEAYRAYRAATSQFGNLQAGKSANRVAAKIRALSQ